MRIVVRAQSDQFVQYTDTYLKAIQTNVWEYLKRYHFVIYIHIEAVNIMT